MVESLNMAEIPPPPDALKNLMFQNFNLAIFRFPPPSLARYWTAAPLTNSPPFPASHKVRRSEGRICGLSLYTSDQVREAPPCLPPNQPPTLSEVNTGDLWNVHHHHFKERHISTRFFFGFDLIDQMHPKGIFWTGRILVLRRKAILNRWNPNVSDMDGMGIEVWWRKCKAPLISDGLPFELAAYLGRQKLGVLV